jgi:peptidyl-prolyl cis-trans isomerase C
LIIPTTRVSGFILLTSLAAIAACQRSGPTTNQNAPIVAMIGEDVISLAEFETALADAMGRNGVSQDYEESETLKDSLLDQMINQHLLLGEARRLNLEATPQELEEAIARMKGTYTEEEFFQLMQEEQIERSAWEDNLRREIVIQKVIASATGRPVEVLEEEIRHYFESHKEEFRKDASVRARQIIVPGMDEAQDIRALLLEGQDFIEIALSRSVSPDSTAGGDLGIFSPGEMPEEFDVVFDLNVGEISPVVKSPYGHHLFRVEERFAGRDLTLAEASGRIRDYLAGRKRKQLHDEWLAGLRKNADIRINRTLLASARIPGTGSAGRPE